MGAGCCFSTLRLGNIVCAPHSLLADSRPGKWAGLRRRGEKLKILTMPCPSGGRSWAPTRPRNTYKSIPFLVLSREERREGFSVTRPKGSEGFRQTSVGVSRIMQRTMQQLCNLLMGLALNRRAGFMNRGTTKLFVVTQRHVLKCEQGPMGKVHTSLTVPSVPSVPFRSHREPFCLTPRSAMGAARATHRLVWFFPFPAYLLGVGTGTDCT
jgi:hypothetical protein